MKLRIALIFPLLGCSAIAQQGAKNGDWKYYGGDTGTTKYSSLDQINASNVKELKIAWRWKAENFGKRPDFNWEVTPLAVNGILYATAGTRRDVVAIDGATGETLWMYRLDEGARGVTVARPQNRGLAYWTDGKGDERIISISPGFQMVQLDAKTGHLISGFGKSGVLDLTEGLDRQAVRVGSIGSSSPAIVIKDVIVVGAALNAGANPVSMTNVPGYIRGFDVHTGKLVWTFRTVPQPGEFGNETWEKDSWKYSGNTGSWMPLSADEELGYVYISVEMPTGDYYGGHRPGDNLFGSSMVCLDAKTGKRIWHYQLVHHDIWDMDGAAAPMLLDVTVNGKKIKAVAAVSKQAFTYVFDRVTGVPVWPIVERPVPQSDVPGEKTAPTQPFPTKPAPFDIQGTSEDILIDFTPEIKAEAVRIASQYKLGPLFTPPIVADSNGKSGTLLLPSHVGGSNWQGGAVDPETGMMYVSSVTNADALGVAPADPKRSDMAYVGRQGPSRAAFTAPPGAAPVGALPPSTGVQPGGPGSGSPAAAAVPAGVNASTGVGFGINGELNIARPAPTGNIGPQGLPLVKPPWGRIVAIDLNTGDHAWMIPNGKPPEYVVRHPLMKGIDLSKAGRPSRAPLMVTKTLLFSADGSNLFNSVAGGGGETFRAHDKKTGATLMEIDLPAQATGIPMTYTAGGRQFIVVAVGATGTPAELVALALP